MSDYESDLERRCEELEQKVQDLEDRAVSMQNALGHVYSKISRLPNVAKGIKSIEYELLDEHADIPAAWASDLSVVRTEINNIHDSCKDKCYDEILKWQKRDNDILGSEE
jgi:phage host-nuclease inhibitor protein Gam